MSTDLPPEAYTRDTLQAAFDWLQSQPDVIRNSVHTPDRLVSLYRKSQRLEDSDHPVSSKKFISDLKNLATSLDQFDGKPRSFNLSSMNPPSANTAPIAPAVTFEPQRTPDLNPRPAPIAPAQPTVTPPLGMTQTTTERVQKASFEVTTKTQETTTSQLQMDELTLQRVESVKKRFNLSSSEEALRLLVAIGYEKFSNFP